MRYLVLGAAGYAEEVAWSLSSGLSLRGEKFELRFFDDAVPCGRLKSELGEVVGGLDSVCKHVDGDEVALVLGIGLPRSKMKVVELLAPLRVPWATVIHPLAAIGPNVVIGEGSYVGAGSVITVNARLGRFVTVNLHCQVAHDDVIGDFVTLHPDTHLSGNVTLGPGCELGTGSIVIPGTAIGAWAVIGAGGVAVHSLAGGETYVGLPAKSVVRVPGPPSFAGPTGAR